MSKELKGSLIEILEAIEEIESLTRGYTFEEFSNNLVAIRAVARDFAIIEKASKQVPGMSKKKFIQSPLKTMMDIRNKMIPIHVYMKPGVMWDAAKNDLPVLKVLIEEFLDDFGSE